MLAIRLKRMGSKNNAHYRVIVQDSHRSPSTGKIVEFLGNYNPHSKEANLKTDRIEHFLKHGAQPSQSAAKLFKRNKITLPSWVVLKDDMKKTLKNDEKLRKHQPKEEPAPAPKEEVAEAEAEDAESTPEVAAEEPKADEKASESEEKPEESESKDEEKEDSKESEEPAPKEDEDASEPSESDDSKKEVAVEETDSAKADA